MRILYLCNYYHRAMIFRDAMNQMENKGHFMLAFNSVEYGETIDPKYHSIMDNKVIHCECYRKIDRYFYHLKQNKIQKALIKSIDVNSFDVIHSHTLFNGGWVARKIYKQYHIPYVVTVRNTDLNANLKYPFFIPIARKIVNDAEKVIFLSESYRKAFLDKCFSKKEAEIVKDKTEVVINGLESFWLDNRWHDRNGYHNPLRLLCVGKIDRNKNMTSVLKATKKLNDSGYPTTLTIIGQVKNEEIKKELECEKDVTILPFMTKEELIEYYRNSDIYIMPSIHETFGRVYAEAMTQGLPVVYTKGQGFDGLFSDGEIGYSVEPVNVDEIVKKIGSIVQDYKAISKQCVVNSDIFSWETIANKLNEIYLSANYGSNKK